MRVLRGYRRNERSPFRALTHRLRQLRPVLSDGRNERSPFRALTPSQPSLGTSTTFFGRNERSPFRALTQLVDDACESPITLSRNERSPFRALTLFFNLTPYSSPLEAVEMKEARLGR